MCSFLGLVLGFGWEFFIRVGSDYGEWSFWEQVEVGFCMLFPDFAHGFGCSFFVGINMGCLITPAKDKCSVI